MGAVAADKNNPLAAPGLHTFLVPRDDTSTVLTLDVTTWVYLGRDRPNRD